MNYTSRKESKIHYAWLTLCWFWGFHHKQYYEKEPKVGDVDAMMQRLALIFSRGHLTWGKTAVLEYKCKVCGVTYWTLTRNSQVCRRYGCYMKFHLHPERFTLRRIK